jgi:hypothetical protein
MSTHWPSHTAIPDGQMHTPSLHQGAEPGQTVPHAPQLLASQRTNVQRPSQWTAPSAQV